MVAIGDSRVMVVKLDVEITKKSHKIWVQKDACVASSAEKIDLPEKQKSKNRRSLPGETQTNKKLKLKEVTRLQSVGTSFLLRASKRTELFFGYD